MKFYFIFTLYIFWKNKSRIKEQDYVQVSDHFTTFFYVLTYNQINETEKQADDQRKKRWKQKPMECGLVRKFFMICPSTIGERWSVPYQKCTPVPAFFHF